MPANPFDYVKSINETKENLIVDELSEKSYNPYVTNRSLSYFIDTLFQANEMNRLHFLSKKTQYLFLLNTVRPKKRWVPKWHKQEQNEDVALIMEVFDYSNEKARQVLDLFTVSDMKELRTLVDPGGITKKK